MSACATLRVSRPAALVYIQTRLPDASDERLAEVLDLMLRERLCDSVISDGEDDEELGA